jgi:hypothetical protein
MRTGSILRHLDCDVTKTWARPVFLACLVASPWFVWAAAGFPSLGFPDLFFMLLAMVWMFGCGRVLFGKRPPLRK